MLIAGFQSLKGVNTSAALSQLGMDSMIAVEIQQTIEREFQLFLTTVEIQSLTFDKLSKMGENINNDFDKYQSFLKKNAALVNLFTTVFGDEDINPETCIRLNGKVVGEDEIIFIPGIEGVGKVFSKMISKLKVPAKCLQLKSTERFNRSIFDMSEELLPVNLNLTIFFFNFIHHYQGSDSC